MTLPVPTEADEQIALVHYCRLNGYRYFRVPNETYTTSWKQKAKNHALGVVRGVPDLFVLAQGRLVAIELKRLKGGVVSPEQREWIEALNVAGVPAYVCRGAEQAIKVIEGGEI